MAQGIVTSKKQTPSPKTGHRKLILLVVLSIVIVAAGLAWWLLQHRQELNPQKKSINDSLSAQQQFVQQDPGTDTVGKALDMGNLAELYALNGDCANARATLKQARQIGGESLKDSFDGSQRVINGACQ